MRTLAFKSGFPLLRKELVEMAARKRTYIIRASYAAFLFFCFAVFFYEEYSARGASSLYLLGTGRNILEFLVIFQFCGIYFLLPAMMSVALTYEKERDSLALLILTDLRPREILMQKFVGHLIPVITFLLLSLPIMAIAYSFGGITTDYLSSVIFLLLLACIQVGAISLAASSWCRTTVAAFFVSYGLIGLLYFGIVLIYLLLYAFDVDMFTHEGARMAFALVPPFILADTASTSWGTSSLAGGASQLSLVLVRSIPVIASILLFLLLARAFLIRRAFAPAKNLTVRALKRFDRFLNRANKLVGGIVLVSDTGTLPDYEPIAWREMTKKSLGKARYLVRILLLIEIPVFLIALSQMHSYDWYRGRQSEELSAIVFILWTIAIPAVSVLSANAIASERSRQTLDLLLTTPMSGRDIIRQKMRAVYRLIFVLIIPFITVFIMEAWWEYDMSRYEREISAVTYLISSLLSVVIYLPMFSWFSLWVGMKVRSRARAIIITLVLIIGLICLPFLVLFLVYALTGPFPPYDAVVGLVYFSPITIIICTEFAEFLPGLSPALAIPLNFIWHGAVLLFFRYLCLKNADRYLGRIYHRGEKPVPADSSE